MFMIEILDYSGDVTNSYSVSSVEHAISGVTEEILNGHSADNIRVYKEIDFTVEVSVSIPQE